jgi:hypothetical protein
MHPGYIDIVKNGIKIANRNLSVLLTQFIAGMAMLVIFFIFLFILAFVAIGSMPSLTLETLSPDTITDLVQTSFTLISLGVFFFFSLLLIVALVTAFVHSGNLACIIDTATGKAQGFSAATFFDKGRRFMASMLGLYIMWGLFAIGCFIVFFAVAGVGFEVILIPLKDSGKALMAFLLGVPFIIVLILSAMLFLFFIYAGWALSGIILLIEERHSLSSLSGAYEFIKRHFWDSLLFALLMFVLIFVANIISNSFFGLIKVGVGKEPAMLAFMLLPLMLIGIIIQMYLGLIARSSFVAYYVSRTTPPPVAPAEPPVDDTTSPDEEFIIEPPAPRDEGRNPDA